ncbi:MAG: succinylglutamate desuccinylase/aspartoacylase family protein [Thermodesulfobacteriota bacterium]
MDKNLLINGTEVSPGQNITINFNIARLPSNTLIDLPVYIYRAKKEGPRLLISAGMHGDELNGTEIIRRLTSENRIIPIRGTVIVIPIINIYGFLINSRYLPDGKDLNRTFPGRKLGSLAARIAYTIMNEILPIVDFGVDFHTGGANKNFPQIRCVIEDYKNLELAKAFNPPIIVNSVLRDGSFRKAAHKKGKSILVFEGGESLNFDELSIREGIKGIVRLMHYHGMTKKSVRKSKDIIICDTYWIRSPKSGLFRSYVKYGDKVIPHQDLGSVTDPFGEEERKIKSKIDGMVTGLRSNPIVNQGDALFNIGVL